MSEAYEGDAHTAVGAYVADALDDDERAVFELHLRGCESCRQEVAELTETAAELTFLTEAPPPAALRSSILAQIATVRPLPPEEPAPSGTPVPRLPPGEVAAEAEEAGAGEAGRPEPTDELAARRQLRIRRVLTGLVAAALMAVVALGGWVSILVADQRAQQLAAQQVSELLTAPDARVYATELNGANVSYVVSRERNRALFLGRDVQGPGADKVYQLWTIRGGDATSQGLVAGGGSVTHWFDGPLDGAQAMAVTVEPAGGSADPSSTPLAVVQL